MWNFLTAIWKTNLLAAMEYRAAFLTQVMGMILNNAIYFLFWVVFFNRFKEIRGWQIQDMVLLFGIVAAGYGLGVYLFGNVLNLADMIAKGQLDYYLALPQPVLIHALASHSIVSGMGDFIYGILSFALVGKLDPGAWARFGIGVFLAMTIFIAFMTLVQSLAFWLGSSDMLSRQAINAMLTFSLYPTTLFDGSARFILFTIIPAGFVGALPAEFVRSMSWTSFTELLLASTVIIALSLVVFHSGLKRYESGSAINPKM